MIQYRRMQENDLEQIQKIDQLSFSLPWPKNAYRYELKENPNSLQWVAVVPTPGQEQAARAVGVIVIWLILDEAHIATLAIHPDYRGQGIAHELLSIALADAIDRGACLATLEVRAGNLIAQRLYDAFHFNVVGRRPRYYKDNLEDALIMTASNLNSEYADWLDRRGWALKIPQEGGVV